MSSTLAMTSPVAMADWSAPTSDDSICQYCVDIAEADSHSQHTMGILAEPNDEIERLAVEIGDTSSGLLHDQRSGRLVPDHLAVVGLGGRDCHFRLDNGME